jgi:hypothetical protein
MVGHGVGIGADLGWVGSNYGIGLLSVAGSYRFGTGQKRTVVPFVLGGYSTSVLRGPQESFADAGAGVDMWFRDRSGVRLEVRGHAGMSGYWSRRQIVDYRIAYFWGR